MHLNRFVSESICIYAKPETSLLFYFFFEIIELVYYFFGYLLDLRWIFFFIFWNFSIFSSLNIFLQKGYKPVAANPFTALSPD